MTVAASPAQNGVAPAEAAIIGSCLLDDKAMEWCYLHVPEETFSTLETRRIYGVMCRLRRNHSAVDFATVSGSMTEAEKKKLADTLLAIVRSVKKPENVRHYAKIVHSRYTITKLDRLYEKIRANPQDEDVQQEIRKNWDSLKNEQNTIIPMSEATMRYMDTLGARQSGKITRLLTGYPRFDDVIGGFLEGNLVSVGARPSAGKSAFLLNLADRFMGMGRKILFASAEMTIDELLDRMVSMRSDTLKVSQLRRGNVDFRGVQEVLSGFHDRPFHIIEGGRMTMSRIRSAVESLSPDVLFVDFIQRFTPPNYNIPRPAFFSDIANELKNIAKEKRMIVFAASQLNREIEKEKGRDPQMSDYKESGGIEEAADYSVMLRPEKDMEKAVREIDVFVNKSRNGPCGRVPFDFVRAQTLFNEQPEANRYDP